MKENASHLTRPARRAVAAATLSVFLSCAGFYGSAQAQATPAAATAASAKKGPAEGIDAHIAGLHKRLKITAAQEDLWKNVAQVMRDNADKISTAEKARADNLDTMTAVEDLKAYADITEAHHEAMKAMITAFQPLYDNMSDDQKKTADAVFRDQRHPHGHH